MARTSIELITGYTKAGKTQTKKYLAKPSLSLFDTIQGSKLSTRLTKAFRQPDFEELSQEEFENLSETEQKEYQAKIEEYQEQVAQQFDVLDEVTTFVAEGFDNQFTSEELQKGIPAGPEGLNTLVTVLEKLIAGDVDDTKKVRDRAEEIDPEDLTPEGRYKNYMKVARQLIEDGMDPEKVANMPIHFFLEIVNSKVETKKKAKSFADIF